MIGWLWRALVGHFSSCAHKWVTFLEMRCNPKGQPDKLAGHLLGLRCEKCGDVTQRYVGLR